MELYSAEIEKEVLICILVHEDYSLLKKIDEKDFYFPVNQKIFQIMKELNSSNKPVDIISVKEKAKSKGLNEMEILRYLTEISKRISNIKYRLLHKENKKLQHKKTSNK